MLSTGEASGEASVEASSDIGDVGASTGGAAGTGSGSDNDEEVAGASFHVFLCLYIFSLRNSSPCDLNIVSNRNPNCYQQSRKSNI